MNPQQYLETKLVTCSKYQPTGNDAQFLNQNGLADYIFSKLTSKKFRKWKLDPDSQTRLKEATKLNITNNAPLQFTFPFGGYKLWRLPTQPQVDWAEFFTIAYYAQWLAPIVAAHKPGAVFYFSSDDIIIERMDNISTKDTDAYFTSFQELIQYFAKHFPSNLKFQIKQVSDLYSTKEFETELNQNLEKTKLLYQNPDPKKYQAMLKTSKLNIRWDGAKDLTKLTNLQKQEITNFGPIYHDAYTGLSKRRAFVRGEDKIVVFTTPIPNAIALGTTRTSITKFWTGVGVLEPKGDSYQDRILSPQQYDQFKTQLTATKINLLDLKNFKTILLSKQQLNFIRNK